MADTCFLCEMGAEHVLKGAPAAGQGFGTCSECWVHACPRHGDRTLQFFRCADCIAAGGASGALTEPDNSDPPTLHGEAPRLTALSVGLREEFNSQRMAVVVDWVHRQTQEGGALLADSLW